MKEFLGWLAWTWRNWEPWQKMFMFAMFLQGAGWGLGGDYGLYVTGLGMIIVMGYILKWFVWDSAKASWAKYKEHRNELLTTIKHSEKQ